MDRSGLQRLIPIVLVIIIVVIALAALVSLARTLFFSGSSPAPTPAVNSAKEALINIASDHSVRMTVRGPIVANENFHSYTITASPDTRNMTTYVGYIGQQVDNSQLVNNPPAYEQFVYALNRLNLMEGTVPDGDANDTRGICATGMLFEFEVLQGSNSLRKLWTTSCRSAIGSLTANRAQVTKLFQTQIPDFGKLVGKVNLSS